MRYRLLPLAFVAAWTAPHALAVDPKVTELRFRCEPKECLVRPFESLVVQIQAWGELADSGGGDPKKGRVRKAATKVALQGGNAGWISKPFKLQGGDDGGFLEDSTTTTWMRIFKQASTQFLVKDSVLYTAPEQPGKYTIEAELDGVKGSVAIEVSASAPSLKKPETLNFPPEPRENQPYRALAERYSPFLAQETWYTPKADMPARFDYDGDWAGDNNWDNLEKGTSQAYVYYAVMETATHWFLIYNVFHPQDYSDNCVAGTCHENDNEGLIVTVRKDGSESGKLETLETLAHNNIYSFAANSAIRNGVHSLDGPLELWQETHPVVFIESGGHGIYGAGMLPQERYDPKTDKFAAGTGITLVYKGVAERPRHANDRLAGYDLLPIYDHWWLRALSQENQRTFDEFGPYQPWGNRPGAKAPTMGKTFLGRKFSSNKAKPFWGWHDVRTQKAKVLSAGQWGLDPAYAVSQNLRFPAGQPFSLDYTYNPYLGIGEPPAATAAERRPEEVTAPPATTPAPAPEAPVPAQPVPSAGTLTPGTGPAAPETAGGSLLLLPNEGWVEVSLRVDGTVVLHIQGDTVSPEVLAGQPVSEQNNRFSTALPPIQMGSVKVSKKSGRGNVALVEPPSPANNFTAKVKIEDPRGGADRYEIRLEWKR